MKYDTFDDKDLTHFEPTEKIGLLATLNEDNLPHLTLITSIQAKDPKRLMFGQFTEGLSKKHLKSNPNAAFLILTMDRRMWRGKARYTHAVSEGEDYELFNTKPMFRYNTYFGIHTIHYLDLKETNGQESLPLHLIVPSVLMTLVLKWFARTGSDSPILKPWAENLFNAISSLKFLSCVDSDGYPTIVPILQCQAADSGRLVFSPFAYGRELRKIPENAPVAIFGLTMAMEDVLIRGTYKGMKTFGCCDLGIVDIDWVYNSMPPKQGQIYPVQPIEPILQFQ